MASESENREERKHERKRKINPKRSTNIVNTELQNKLWNLSHELTEHHPGKLEICVGLPVMIKVNEATECCVTNGAEGVVVGWIAKPISETEQALETLFIKLTAAPTPINLPGLPENVIPLSHLSKTVKCKLPNGTLLEIVRDQVPVVPNFAMTDFASQGRTRPNNVCDLQNCRTHQSVYTCLSRGSSLEGTVIVQSFDTAKLTGGIAGSLRQEFRELEILDEITKLRYEGSLPSKVFGITRNELIHSFRQWKGENYVPQAIHTAIKWSSTDPFPIEPVTEDTPWMTIKGPTVKSIESRTETSNNITQKNSVKQAHSLFKPAQGSQALNAVSNISKSAVKRKRDEEVEQTLKKVRAKRIKATKAPQGKTFVGFPWDEENYSCAYDSLLTCLLALYTQCRETWNQTVTAQSQTLRDLGMLFNNTLPEVNRMSLPQARNFFRNLMGARNTELRAKESELTDLYTLVRETLKLDIPVLQRIYRCRTCNYTSDPMTSSKVVWTCDVDFWKANPAKLGTHKGKSVTQWMNALAIQKTNQCCPKCSKCMVMLDSYTVAPGILAFLTPDKVVIETQIVCPNINQMYKLCGIIYYHQAHFVCRFIDKSGGVWFHDGAVNEAKVVYYDNILNWTPKKLQTAGDAVMSVLLYSKL